MSEWYSPQGKRHTPWRIDKENPQNILIGGGIHPIDLILWAVDSPVIEVSMFSNHKCVPDFPSDDCYILIMRFENGVLGKCHVTSGCSGPTWHGFFESYGCDGTLHNGSLYRRGHEPVPLEDSSKGNVVGGHGWAGSVTDFLDLLDGKIANAIPSSAGANNVAVCEAGIKAAQTGQSQRPHWFK
jgi:predicted dehydrogenase